MRFYFPNRLRRRGFLLLDMVLWSSLVGVFLWFAGAQLANYLGQSDIQDEARLLSHLADQAVEEILPDLQGVITTARAAGGALDIGITTLGNYNEVPTLARNRSLHLAYFAPTADTLMVLTYTNSLAGGPSAGYIQAEDTIESVGLIDSSGPCPNLTCGPGIRWNHTPVSTLLTNPPTNGSMVAIRLLDASPQGDSFLWSVGTGVPGRTTMSTDLDLNGHNLLNVNALSSSTVVPAHSQRVDGNTRAATLASGNGIEVSGDLTVTGTTNLGKTAVEDVRIAGDVDIINDLPVNRLAVDGRIDLGADLTLATNLSVPAITGDLTADALNLATLSSTGTTVGGKVIVNRATTGDATLDRLRVSRTLYVTKCTGLGCTTSDPPAMIPPYCRLGTTFPECP